MGTEISYRISPKEMHGHCHLVLGQQTTMMLQCIFIKVRNKVRNDDLDIYMYIYINIYMYMYTYICI